MASKPARQRAQAARGFTLIEVMVTVAIVAILAAIAYPSYINYVVRSNRAAAESYMQEVAAAQERYLLDNRAYTSNLASVVSAVPAGVASNYTISIQGVTSSPPAYSVVATPIASGAQAANDTGCGQLALTNTGSRLASGAATNCWK